MTLIDRFLKKPLSEQESYEPLNILVCFSKPETGKALCKIANLFMQSKLKNEQIASLHLLEKEEFDKIENIETFKASLYEGVMEECRKGNAMIRTFVKSSDDFVNDILSTSKELDCNLVLIGIGKTVFLTSTVGLISKIQS